MYRAHQNSIANDKAKALLCQSLEKKNDSLPIRMKGKVDLLRLLLTQRFFVRTGMRSKMLTTFYPQKMARVACNGN